MPSSSDKMMTEHEGGSLPRKREGGGRYISWSMMLVTLLALAVYVPAAMNMPARSRSGFSSALKARLSDSIARFYEHGQQTQSVANVEGAGTGRENLGGLGGPVQRAQTQIETQTQTQTQTQTENDIVMGLAAKRNASFESVATEQSDVPTNKTERAGLGALPRPRLKDVPLLPSTLAFIPPHVLQEVEEIIAAGGFQLGGFEFLFVSDDQDYQGHDLAEFHPVDGKDDMMLEECAEKCQMRDDCNAISYHYESAGCWLKSKLENPVPRGRVAMRKEKGSKQHMLVWAAKEAMQKQIDAEHEFKMLATKKERTERAGKFVAGPPGLMCSVLINLFTTFIENTQDQRKIAAQHQVLKAYQRLRSHGVQAWLFSDSEHWRRLASEHNVLVRHIPATNEHGTPRLDAMYQHVIRETDAHQATCRAKGEQDGGMVFDAYTNGDIVYTSALVDTLEAVKHMWARDVASGKRKGVMVVGKRTNVEHHTEDAFNSDEDIDKAAERGQRYTAIAQDYFIYSRGAKDWEQMPAFVVGRRAYDNWLVDNSNHDEFVDVIDASNTILALHLTAADGNSAGHAERADKEHNVNVQNPATGQVVSDSELDHGKTDHAFFYTKREGTAVKVVKRRIAYIMERSRQMLLNQLLHLRLPRAFGIALIVTLVGVGLALLTAQLRMWRSAQECAQGQPHARYAV